MCAKLSKWIVKWNFFYFCFFSASSRIDKRKIQTQWKILSKYLQKKFADTDVISQLKKVNH